MKHESLKIQKIYLKKQNVNSSMIKEVLHILYKNIRFSTFPYLTYKISSSLQCLKQYNSGNCIAMADFIKIYLKQNYNVDTYIVGASVPEIFKVENNPTICHCAVFIPISQTEFYILDPAFYFLEPMYCNLDDNIERKIENSDIYSHSKSNVFYIIDICETNEIDNLFNQQLMPESLCVSCYFENDNSQTWNYYLNEIINPDESIGSHFLEQKYLPFLLYTDYDFKDNMVKLSHKIFIDENGDFVIKKYPEKEILFKGDINDLNENSKLYYLIQHKMKEHFDNFIV